MQDPNVLLLHRIFILDTDQDQRCDSFNQASLRGNSNFALERALTFKTISLVHIDDGNADPRSNNLSHPLIFRHSLKIT